MALTAVCTCFNSQTLAKVILKTAAIKHYPVINFQFDETHLIEITREVSEVLGKENLALPYSALKFCH